MEQDSAEQRAEAALRVAAAETAPLGLHARVERMHRAPERRRRMPLRLSLAGGLVTAVLVVALVLVGTSAGGPTVAEAAALGQRPPEAGPPAARTATLLQTEIAGVAFPAWAEKFGWRAVGVRTDKLGDRATQTVFYQRGDRRIAYTIVSGDELDKPDGPTRTVLGTELTAIDGGVTWTRQGHTCVLTGAPRDVLDKLAAWNGKGTVPF